MKETRVYLINLDEIQIETEKELSRILESNELFMEEAEHQGYVYTLESFQETYNNSHLCSDNSYIRIIKVKTN
jgi:hypothetical protein